jgi:hypothetical protein
MKWTFKYFVWKNYLRQETGLIGTHIAAGPRITSTMIATGLALIISQGSVTWYVAGMLALIAFQVWLSFELFGIGYPDLVKYTKEEIDEYEKSLNQ